MLRRHGLPIIPTEGVVSLEGRVLVGLSVLNVIETAPLLLITLQVLQRVTLPLIRSLLQGPYLKTLVVLVQAEVNHLLLRSALSPLTSHHLLLLLVRKSRGLVPVFGKHL
mmetsp:Transcript_43447/g.41908  ORF Transcript_43447/g.41908 Transcript_43447/m.41908 type:complete len:110 (-) Transcript_43447:36-365(-)